MQKSTEPESVINELREEACRWAGPTSKYKIDGRFPMKLMTIVAGATNPRLATGVYGL